MSSQQHDYLFFADDRSGIPTSTMHLADQIAKTNRVFWINIYTRLPKLSLSEFRKAWKILTRRRATAAVNQQVSDSQIIAATPLQIPFFGKTERRCNGFFAGNFYKKFVKHYGIQNPVLVTNFPCVVDAFRTIRKIDPKAKQIYYCFDDFIEYPGFNPKHWQTMEQEFFSNIDGAVFTSRDLQTKKKRPESLPNLYLPHGVDYEHFTPNSAVKIEQLESLPKPVVGFYGTIDTWVDIGAIAALAERFPKCSFVVIGHSNVPLTIFDGIRNIHCTGRVPYSELPQYARYFDVGLIPFVVNDLTLAVNPLKLMEYYAIGIPVISTRLPDIADVPGPLYFADTHEEFGNRLDEILKSDLPELRRQAQDVAKQNSWSARAEELMKFVETIK